MLLKDELRNLFNNPLTNARRKECLARIAGEVRRFARRRAARFSHRVHTDDLLQGVLLELCLTVERRQAALAERPLLRTHSRDRAFRPCRSPLGLLASLVRKVCFGAAAHENWRRVRRMLRLVLPSVQPGVPATWPVVIEYRHKLSLDAVRQAAQAASFDRGGTTLPPLNTLVTMLLQRYFDDAHEPVTDAAVGFDVALREAALIQENVPAGLRSGFDTFPLDPVERLAQTRRLRRLAELVKDEAPTRAGPAAEVLLEFDLDADVRQQCERVRDEFTQRYVNSESATRARTRFKNFFAEYNSDHDWEDT